MIKTFRYLNQGFVHPMLINWCQNVHIEQKVCPFWLKVWSMKNTLHLTSTFDKSDILNQVSNQISSQNGQMSIKMAMA
jgi:hypothetical protein